MRPERKRFVPALFDTVAISPAAGIRVVFVGLSVLVLTEVGNALRRR
jgi:hypothetical protein